MENFIARGKYKENFGASLKGKQSSFLDRYNTDKPIESNESKVVIYLSELPEGLLLMEFENKQQQNDFVKIVKENNPSFANKGFVILQTSERTFEKKLLNYLLE